MHSAETQLQLVWDVTMATSSHLPPKLAPAVRPARVEASMSVSKPPTPRVTSLALLRADSAAAILLFVSVAQPVTSSLSPPILALSVTLEKEEVQILLLKLLIQHAV